MVGVKTWMGKTKLSIPQALKKEDKKVLLVQIFFKPVILITTLDFFFLIWALCKASYEKKILSVLIHQQHFCDISSIPGLICLFFLHEVNQPASLLSGLFKLFYIIILLIL